MKISRRKFYVIIGILAAVIIALAWMNISQAAEKTWDVCYPMANQHIEWTWAGR